MIHAANRGFEKAWSDLLHRVRRLELASSPLASAGSVTINEVVTTGGGGGTTGGVAVTEGASPPDAPNPGDIWIKT